MRFRSWIFLALLVAFSVPLAPPAAAEDFDQVRIISNFADKLEEPAHVPTQWLDLGVSIPVSSFEDRNWEPGLLVRWSQEVWWQGPLALVGSLGVLFNDDSNFNEAQVDASADGAFDSFIPVTSRRHVMAPFAVELQFQPTSRGSISPFVAGGPAIQYTHESRVRQDWYVIIQAEEDPYTFVLVPFETGPPVLLADQALTKTHFHPGYQIRAGIRGRVGSGPQPLNMRLTASLNTWYEHDHPVSVVGGALSFGR